MDRQPFRTKLAGNFIALPTPFHDDFSLDLETLRRLVRRLLEAGFRTGNGVLLAGGAAGEFATLRTEERKRVAEVVVEEAAAASPSLSERRTPAPCAFWNWPVLPKASARTERRYPRCASSCTKWTSSSCEARSWNARRLPLS